MNLQHAKDSKLLKAASGKHLYLTPCQLLPLRQELTEILVASKQKGTVNTLAKADGTTPGEVESYKITVEV